MRLLITVTKALFLFIFIFSNISYGRTDWNTGEVLLKHCDATLRLQDIDNPTQDDHIKSVACLSYLEGVKQVIYESESFAQQKNICFPDFGISNGQAARIYVNYLDVFPEKKKNHKLNTALEAFAYSFPCS